jgi:hypothetical protein
LVLNEVKPNIYRETYLQICITERPNPCLSGSGWRNNASLLGFAALCTNLHEVKPNVYRETYLKIFLPIDPIHVYPALVDVIMLVCWASLRSAPTYKNHATAPEVRPPVCWYLIGVLLWSGSLLTPTRHYRERLCYRTELVWEAGEGGFMGKIKK